MEKPFAKCKSLIHHFCSKMPGPSILKAVMGSSISKRTINLTQSSKQVLDLDKMSAYILTHTVVLPQSVKRVFHKTLSQVFPRLSS